MHKSKIFVVILIVALLFAGTAQVLQFSTWTGAAVLGQQTERVMKYVQTAALYAFVPLALAGALIVHLASHKDKRGGYTALAESSQGM